MIRDVEHLKNQLQRARGQAQRGAVSSMMMINQSTRFTDRPSMQFGSTTAMKSGRAYIGDGGVENRQPTMAERKSFMQVEENSTPSTGTLENKSAKSGMSEEGSPGPRKDLSSPGHF